MISVTSASRYVKLASRYQSRSSMYIHGLIPLNSTELAEAVQNGLWESRTQCPQSGKTTKHTIKIYPEAIKNVSSHIIRIHHECEGEMEITDWHHEAC